MFLYNGWSQSKKSQMCPAFTLRTRTNDSRVRLGHKTTGKADAVVKAIQAPRYIMEKVTLLKVADNESATISAWALKTGRQRPSIRLSSVPPSAARAPV